MLNVSLSTDVLDKINMLSVYRRERVLELLTYLYSSSQVLGVLLGGSLSYKEDCLKSDVDLFCLIQNKEDEKTLKESLIALHEIDTVIFQGFFPWTQKLYTLFYKQDIDFTIDVCLVGKTIAQNFFWEPDGAILFDKEGLIESNRTLQLSSPNYSRHPFLKQNPFALSVITLKKIEKNLSRNHIWNAFELLNILRRYIMQLLRLYVIKDKNFLGRVDRDIEDVLPEEINMQLTETIASYNVFDIAQKTVILIDMLRDLFKQLNGSSEKEIEEWFMRQLQHEREKISAYKCTKQNTSI